MTATLANILPRLLIASLDLFYSLDKNLSIYSLRPFFSYGYFFNENKNIECK